MTSDPHSSISLLYPSFDQPLYYVSITTHFLINLFLSFIIIIMIIKKGFLYCTGVYGFCDGPRLSRGPYLGIATICSVLSLVFVSLKAAYVFRRGYSGAVEVALFVCSFVLAIGHVAVAYRTSCRERRKLLVYKIDIEAVSLTLFLCEISNYELQDDEWLYGHLLDFLLLSINLVGVGVHLSCI